jgi:hypothetical protein
MVDGMMGEGVPEQEEPATMVQCPNCGATLKLEVEQPEEDVAAEPSIRDALAGAMGNGAA